MLLPSRQTSPGRASSARAGSRCRKRVWQRRTPRSSGADMRSASEPFRLPMWREDECSLAMCAVRFRTGVAGGVRFRLSPSCTEAAATGSRSPTCARIWRVTGTWWPLLIIPRSWRRNWPPGRTRARGSGRPGSMASSPAGCPTCGSCLTSCSEAVLRPPGPMAWLALSSTRSGSAWSATASGAGRSSRFPRWIRGRGRSSRRRRADPARRGP